MVYKDVNEGYHRSRSDITLIMLTLSENSLTNRAGGSLTVTVA